MDGIDGITLVKSALLASLMTLGWSLMVNVPKRYIWQCLLITAIGYSVRVFLLQLHMNIILSTFFAAALTAFMGIYFAKRFLITPKAVLVPALLCMMPGITAYKAMISLVQLGYQGYHPDLFAQTVNVASNALFVTAALVFGLSLPAAIFYRKQPIV